jgi:ribosomal protein L11 methyltransferase
MRSATTPANSPSLVARLETDEQAAHAIGDLIVDRFAGEDVAVSLSDHGGRRWQVAIHFRGSLDKDDVGAAVEAAAGPEAAATLQFDRVATTDWVRQSLAGLEPVAAGRFVVHGAHDRTRIPPNRIGIEIEAALAFGTGHHGTTRGCLLALDAICKVMRKPKVLPSPCNGKGRDRGGGRGTRPRQSLAPTRLAIARRLPRFSERDTKILDIGTGSGVLAIAAARALHARVLATDIDAGAVRAARDNVRLNRAGGLVTIVQADGVCAPAIRARRPFDLILANILLGPLQRMATPLRRLTAPGARLVLSGILPLQANAVIAAYRPLALERRYDIGGWSTLVFVRRARRHRSVARRHRASQSAS